MPTCAAFNCPRKDTKEERLKGFTFHRFPHCQPELLKQWLVNLKRDNFQPSNRAVLCSAHFEKRFFKTYTNHASLMDHAVPTIFSFPAHLQKRIEHRKALTERVCSASTVPDHPSQERWQQQVGLREHSYSLVSPGKPSTPEDVQGTTPPLKKKKKKKKTVSNIERKQYCIYIGEQYKRWMQLGDELGLNSDAAIAEILLNVFYEKCSKAQDNAEDLDSSVKVTFSRSPTSQPDMCHQSESPVSSDQQELPEIKIEIDVDVQPQLSHTAEQYEQSCVADEAIGTAATSQSSDEQTRPSGHLSVWLKKEIEETETDSFRDSCMPVSTGITQALNQELEDSSSQPSFEIKLEDELTQETEQECTESTNTQTTQEMEWINCFSESVTDTGGPVLQQGAPLDGVQSELTEPVSSSSSSSVQPYDLHDPKRVQSAYMCKECGDIFLTLSNLTVHLQEHTEGGVEVSGMFATHTCKDTGKRLYLCTKCDAAFTDTSRLSSHMRTHPKCVDLTKAPQ